MIKDKIYKDRNAARLAKDVPKVSILTLVKGEIETIETRTGKPVDDEGTISILKKLVDACWETNDMDEVSVLESYIPMQLSYDAIVGILREFEETPNKGQVFGYFKKNYTGLYNGNDVKKAFEELFE